VDSIDALGVFPLFDHDRPQGANSEQPKNIVESLTAIASQPPHTMERALPTRSSNGMAFTGLLDERTARSTPHDGDRKHMGG